jgi:hypothetical protein
MGASTVCLIHAAALPALLGWTISAAATSASAEPVSTDGKVFLAQLRTGSLEGQ